MWNWIPILQWLGYIRQIIKHIFLLFSLPSPSTLSSTSSSSFFFLCMFLFVGVLLLLLLLFFFFFVFFFYFYPPPHSFHFSSPFLTSSFSSLFFFLVPFFFVSSLSVNFVVHKFHQRFESYLNFCQHHFSVTILNFNMNVTKAPQKRVIHV